MANWLRRYLQRQDDLARGVDADLVRENRARGRRGLLSFAASLLIIWLVDKTHLHGLAAKILLGAAFALFLYAFFVLTWAKEQSAFLNKPEPEKPLSLFKHD